MNNFAKPEDWREKKMAQIRKLIREADPEATEEQKYKMASRPEGIPVWYHNGMICTGETYKNHLRLTFPNGNSFKDKDKTLFNRYKAVIIEEKDKIDESAFKNLVRAASAFNKSKKKN